MSIFDDVTEDFRRRIGDDNGVVTKTMKIVMADGEGVVFLDMASTPNTVSNEDKPANLTMTAKMDTVRKLLTAQADGRTLLMTGKLKLKGDIRIAMKMGDILKMKELPINEALKVE